MKLSNLFLAGTLLNITPGLCDVQVTTASDALMEKYYPDLVKSSDYAGGILITNSTGTDVGSSVGAVTDLNLRGAFFGIVLAYTVGGGYQTIRNAINDCTGGKDGDGKACVNDILHVLCVHAGGLAVGNHFGAAWIWANLAAEVRPAGAKRSTGLAPRTCPPSETWPLGAHFTSHTGIKMTCKQACLQADFSQLNDIADTLKLGATLSPMEAKDAGAYQFTVFHQGGTNDGKVYMRCHMVGQIDHPNTCAADISGSGCPV
jgi:hypothetical protein